MAKRTQVQRSNGKNAAQPAMPPMPGTYRVRRPGGGAVTFAECFIQLGSVNDLPGALLIFHSTGLFTLAAFAPGEWASVERIEKQPEVTEPELNPEAEAL